MMDLVTVEIENFRGYKDKVSIPITDITTFIGRNDSGKSTILVALKIFLTTKQ